MKNLAKKIGIGVLSTFLLGSCATQKYSTMDNLINSREYVMTQKILKKENRDLEKLERKYNKSLEKGETMQSPDFIKLLQDYESQKSKVQKYEDILKLNEEKNYLQNNQ
jgi:hypothetical protein